jgi:hypothetical protein
MFEAEQVSFAERMQEVRTLHQIISELESPDPLQADSTRVIILRGLFYVLLYAGFEFAVNQIVSATLREISSAAVETAKLERPVFTLALNQQLMSLESGLNNSKWERRLKLFEAQAETKPCVINDSVLSMYLQNIGRDSLEQVFSCFGITAQIVPMPRYFGYLDELVEKRRAVSHGRTRAEDAGRGYRSAELLKRLDAVTDVVAHLENTFTTYVSERMYIAAAHRQQAGQAQS